MPFSAAALASRARTRVVLRRIVATLGAILVSSGAFAPASGAQTTPTIVRMDGSLTWGTVLPGLAPVVIAPWSNSAVPGRRAAVFQITANPNQTVYVKPLMLTTTLENTGGSTVLVTAYTMSFNTVWSPAGAVALPCLVGQEVAVTLGTSGKGYLSIGATLITTAGQPKGGYGIVDGGILQVR